MNKTIITIVIIVVLFIGGYFLLNNNTQVPVQNNTQNQNFNPNEWEYIPDEKIHEINYTDSGYSPKELNIKVGDTVTWKNESSHGMWTSSAMHPTHIIYSGTSLDEHCPDPQNTSFDECTSAQPGEFWSFRFDKKGTWRYHNHVQTSDFGSVIVE